MLYISKLLSNLLVASNRRLVIVIQSMQSDLTFNAYTKLIQNLTHDNRDMIKQKIKEEEHTHRHTHTYPRVALILL